MGNTNVKPHPKPRNKKQLRWKAADRPLPPGKPSLIQENSLTPDVVHICWPKPEKDGGSTVTSYLVEHRRVGTGHWLKSSQFQIITNELSVNGLEPGWRYQFRVRAENAVGMSDPSEISEPYIVTLQRSAIAAPKFTAELKDTGGLDNGKVEFEVNFLGQPPPSICWFKDGFEIFSGNRTRITTVSDKSVLTILHASATDVGEIKCTATNRAGHASTKCKLTIEAPPSIKLPKSYQDQDGIIFEIGETIKLNIKVGGRPIPLIFWSHDSESIQNNDRYEIEFNDGIASVKIENALRSDRGEYQIKAVNKLGEDHASFLVTITDKPTPPGKARVLLTSGKSVTLCWSTPKDDGGCRIGNYIIEYYRIGWDVWLKAATTRQLSTMLGDLIEGSQYKFRVKAESPYGVSDPSEESELVFIPDVKRGIQEFSDVKQNGVESRIPLAKRRRANSTPRVSFVLNEDAPIRPERKKTGKTPEASPRLGRKQISTFTKNVLGSEPSLNRNFSNVHPGAEKAESSNISPSTLWKHSLVPNFPENSFKQSTRTQVEKKKSPSPEIIITDADVENPKILKQPKTINSPEKSPSRSPNFFERSSWDYTRYGKSPPRSPKYIENLSNQSWIYHDIEPAKMSKNFEQLPRPNYTQISPSNSPNSSENLKSRSPNSSEKSPPRSPNPSEKSPSSSPNNVQKSPSRSPNPFERTPRRSPSELEASQSPTQSFHQKSPPRSPENSDKSPSSPDEGPGERRHNLDANSELRTNNFSFSNTITKLQNDDKSQSPQMIDRMKPPLRQEFSGSSEFMLVLCPEGEQGTRFKRFSISFDENSIPPPMSLSAPELGIEPPELPTLKRSASSSELLAYRLMERLHEAAMCENNIEPNRANSNIPTIRVNSEPTTEFNPIEENSSFKRRLSGIFQSPQSSWSNRRYSLKNAKETNDTFATKLHRFEESDQMRREVAEYRKISESEHEPVDNRGMGVDEDEWMEDYEESVPSEEESDVSSPDERKLSLVPHPRQDFHDDDEEMYNPRDRMMSAVQADKDKPFEILTVRKDPPKSNIVPKPILKKTLPSSNVERSINSRTAQPLKFEASSNQQQDFSSTEMKQPASRRNRSISLSEAFEDELDVSYIKRSPTPKKRRSFSLMPSEANFMKDAYKTKKQKKVNESDGAAKNVSALANFTSIAGAGFVIPNEMQEKKGTDEEAKVVVDFYGDIVRNFGGKSKPTAEFSRSLVSKYDTYEERKISDIKLNTDTLASHKVRSTSPNFSDYQVGKQENVVPPTKSSQFKTSFPLTEHPARQSNFQQTQDSGGKFFSNLKSASMYSNDYGSEQTPIQTKKESNSEPMKMNIAHSESFIYPREMDESLRQMRAEMSETNEKSSTRYQDRGHSSNRHIPNTQKTYRESKRSGRPGLRQSLVGRRKKTPMSRDASTSPVRFSDDWDSQCSSKTSLEQDYYNRGSVTSSRASSLSRRSLSPPRPKLRGITTQTSFRIEATSPADVQERINLAKKAEKRMSFVLEYSTDLAMVAVAAWMYLFQNEYFAVPFIVIPIYRQLGEKIKKFNEGVEKRLPQWIRKRFGRNRLN